jgi:hypothetical protein
MVAACDTKLGCFGDGMKRKVHYRIQLGQPASTIAQAQHEIHNFLQALDSYPARAAKEPGITFHEHLCTVLDEDEGSGETRMQRH